MKNYCMTLPPEIGVYLDEMTRAHGTSVEEEVRIALRYAYVSFLDAKLEEAREALLRDCAVSIDIPAQADDGDDSLPF